MRIPKALLVGLVAFDVAAVAVALAVTWLVLAFRRDTEPYHLVARQPTPASAPASYESSVLVPPTARAPLGNAPLEKESISNSFISAHFLSDYLSNRTYGKIVDARPWTNTSLNRWQYSQELGGVTLWDYFATRFGQGFDEDWESERYGWQDDQGKWHSYHREVIQDTKGQSQVSYVLVDRTGVGVVDTIVFTMHSTDARPKDRNPDLLMWGYLSHLGRLRIEVDNRIAYDVPVEDWFSGKAVCLSPDLAKLFYWRYQDFGSNGNVLPIPYRNRIKISVYGGTEQPKWFTLTGVTLPPGTAVEPLTGCLDSAFLSASRSLSENVMSPESYLDRLGDPVEIQELAPRVQRQVAGVPLGKSLPSQIVLDGAGTLTALQFRIPKNYDAAALQFQVRYGQDTAVDIPVVAFFSDQDKLVPHRSTPIGVVDSPGDANSYLLYSNYPLPFQQGMTIELTTRGAPVVITARYARSAQVMRSRFRAVYDDYRQHPPLRAHDPDYAITIPGSGKLVGIVFAARDQNFDRKKIPAPPPEVFRGNIVFPMGFMESNVTLKDGSGVLRVYTGLEDLAGGGYTFNSDQGSGSKNLFFAGVLSSVWQPREKGYLSIFKYFGDLSAFRFKRGLTLSFQHGTWKNNYPMRYGLTVFYYADFE